MLENHRHLRELGIDLDSTEATRWPAVYKRAGSYEASKLESALRVREYAATNAMQWVEVQPATVSGHSQSGELDAGQPLWALIDNLFHGRLALIPGSQQHWLPLVAVDTVASMIARAALAKQVPPRLLVLDPETPNLAGLLGLLAAELEVRAPIRHIPVSVLRGLLSLPGMERLMNTSRESLDFLQVERFDTADTLAFGRSEGLVLPAVADSVKASARYWKQHQQFRY